ncbi:hypothetical protein [Rouxiella badensis]|jgi:hypothetical protein|uniref:hypothetical protein n=1 Tax=Rouxiella badensis TaxID=1646377 RepID=UPI0003756C68|nr:hypothetical protein [Rouxiella badensis]WAT10131.1 hypothetical protein O1V65_06090 [Rouxiella badensis]
MKMNQQNDGAWTHFWATITALASAAGLTTEQWVYVFCAILGAILSFSSYLNNKRALKERQIQDEKRTEVLQAYLAGKKASAEADPATVASNVSNVIGEMEEADS